jgi:UDP-N-acetylglucosamine 2-epimerase (non-hydrolysing)
VRIACVVGARPNFVKIASLAAAFRRAPGVSATLIHTGQHWDHAMSEVFFRDLEIPAPDVNLGVAPADPLTQLAETLRRLGPVLTAARPDRVLVVGDASSTLAGALAAAKLGLSVAHVEAGLRSFDRTMPEETNRVLTDAVSALLFTTEPAANENLAREGIPSERVHFVGNVMIDTLLRYRERAERSSVLERLALARHAYAVLTLHRPHNVDEPETLGRALEALARIRREMTVVFPVHPRARRCLEVLRRRGAVPPGLHLTEPLPYLDFVRLMANARCVLTDSGGVQEETTALGVPCLTLRSSTERPITVVQGTNRIVGLDPARIDAAWEEIRRGRWPAGRIPELWDGKAAERVVGVLLREHGTA